MAPESTDVKVISRESIQAIDDLTTELVEVPEWGGSLYVRSLSGKERDDFEISMLRGKGRKQTVNLANLRAKLCVLVCVDGPDVHTAKPVFKPQDAAWLGQKSAQALQRVFVVAQRLSGLTDDDVEELTSDLGEDPSDGSGSS